MAVEGISWNVQTSAAKNSGSRQTDQVKESFSSYLSQETKSLEDIFNRAAERYDLPAELLKAVGKAESAFKTDVVSSSGAQGVMQLMPATAAYLGVTDPFDPEQNIMGGAKYLASLMERFDGDVKLALAGYNAGPGNVAKYGGIPPFKETQNYVKKVMGYMGESIDLTGTAVQGGAGSSVVSAAAYPTAVVPPSVTKEEAKIDDNASRWNELLSYDDYELMIKILYGEEEQQKQQKDGEDDSSVRFGKMSFSSAFANLFLTQN